jgi:FMN phosphatase YigB (HAD superfamily)
VGSVSVTGTSVDKYLTTRDFECIVHFENAFKILIVQMRNMGLRTCYVMHKQFIKKKKLGEVQKESSIQQRPANDG